MGSAALAIALLAAPASADEAPPDDFTVSKIQFTLFGRDDGARTRDKVILSGIGGDKPKARIKRDGADDYVEHALSAGQSEQIAALVWALRDRPAVPNGFDTDLAQIGFDGAERYTLSMRTRPSQDFNNFSLKPGDGDLDPDILALTKALIEVGGFAHPPGAPAPQSAARQAAAADDAAPQDDKVADVAAAAPEPADATKAKVAEKAKAKETEAPTPSDGDEAAGVTADMYAMPGDLEIRRFEFNLVGLDDSGRHFRLGRVFLSRLGEDDPTIAAHDARGDTGSNRKLTVEEARRIVALVRALQRKPADPKTFSTDLALFGLEQAAQYNVSISAPRKARGSLLNFTIQPGDGYVDSDAAALVGALLEIGGFVKPGAVASRDAIAAASAVDPVVEHCQRNAGGDYYDCQCVGDKAGEARAELAAQRNTYEIEGLERQIEKLKARKESAAGNPSRLEGFEKKIANYEQRLAEARRTPPDLASIRSAPVMKFVTDMPACRNRDGTYERSFGDCMRTTNADQGVASAYCECVANNTADAWVEAASAASVRNLDVRARTACQELRP